MSRLAGHEHHALAGPGDAQPLVSAAERLCETHALVEPLFSPERAAQFSGHAALAAVLPESMSGQTPDPEERVKDLWQTASLLSASYSISLRI